MPIPPRPLRLPIVDPCREDWDAMPGAGPRRACDVCRTEVTNLSELTERQATAFLRRVAGEHVCVRYASDAAGNIRFRAPTVAAPAPTAMSGWRATLAAAGLAALGLGACTGERLPDRVGADRCAYDLGPFGFELARGEGNCPSETDESTQVVMGAIALPRVEPDPGMKMGEIVIEDPVPQRGSAPVPEPPPEPIVERMGDIAAPSDLDGP